MALTKRTLINLGKSWGHVVTLEDLRDIRRIKTYPDGRVAFGVWGHGDTLNTSIRCFKRPDAAVKRILAWQEEAEKTLGPSPLL